MKTKLTSQTAIQLPCSLLKDSNLVCNRFFAKSKSSTLQRWGSALLRTGTKVAFWFLHALKNAARKALKFWFSTSLLASASMLPHYPAKKTRKTRKVHNLVGSNHRKMTSWSTNESRNIFRFMQQNHHQPFFQGIYLAPPPCSQPRPSWWPAGPQHLLADNPTAIRANPWRSPPPWDLPVGTRPAGDAFVHQMYVDVREKLNFTLCLIVVNSVITGDLYVDE